MTANGKPGDTGITTAEGGFLAASRPDSARPSQLSIPDLRKRTPWFLIILAAAACAWLLAAAEMLSDAGDGGLASLALIGGGFLLGIFWLAAVCLLASMPRPLSWRAWAWAAVVPAAGALGHVLASTDAGLALRLWVSEPALKRYAAATAPHHSPPGEWVGLFRVHQLDASGEAFALYTDTQGLFDRAGVAYLPPGSEPPPGVRVKRRLYGDWYSFWWKF